MRISDEICTPRQAKSPSIERNAEKARPTARSSIPKPKPWAVILREKVIETLENFSPDRGSPVLPDVSVTPGQETLTSFDCERR